MAQSPKGGDGEMIVCIDMEEGDPLGATPNDKLVIVKVQPGTVSEGHLKVGDQVKKVNDMPVKDQNDFFKALRYAHPQARIAIIRDAAKATEVTSRVRIPQERESLIKRRDGFTYELVRLDYVKGSKLGLTIEHFQNRVLVQAVEDNTLASGKFVVGDHIVDIDEVPVTDKEVAKKLIIEGIKKKGWFSCVVERPVNMETKLWVQKALQAEPNQSPSVKLNEDVIAIMKRMREYNKTARAPAKPILTQTSGAKKAQVQIAGQISVHDIGHDHVGRALRRVKN